MLFTLIIGDRVLGACTVKTQVPEMPGGGDEASAVMKKAMVWGNMRICMITQLKEGMRIDDEIASIKKGSQL